MPIKEPEYPEHVKLEIIADKSQFLGEFLDWFQGKYTIAEYVEEALWPARVTVERLLADYFEIDLVALEREKEDMVETLRHREVDCPVCPGPLCERDGEHPL